MDLNKRLESLRQTVQKTTIRRDTEDQVKNEKLRQKKATDWANLQAKHPDAADFITEISKEFGKPAMVVVADETGLILDSRKYDSVRATNQRRK